LPEARHERVRIGKEDPLDDPLADESERRGRPSRERFDEQAYVADLRRLFRCDQHACEDPSK
jgi:hypothetical protein